VSKTTIMLKRCFIFTAIFVKCAIGRYPVNLLVLETSGEVSSPNLLSAAISGAFAGEGLVVTGITPTKTSIGYAIEVAPTDSVSTSTIVSKLSMCEYRTTLKMAWTASPYDLPDASITAVCEAASGATTCTTTLSSCDASGDDDGDDDDAGDPGSGEDDDVTTQEEDEEGLDAGAVAGISIASFAVAAILVVNVVGLCF
jgi:hypothetical protein